MTGDVAVDVAVVGGGPAGSAAAMAAAAGGADVVAIERGVPRTDRDGLGADSTDAGGMMNYWIDLMGFDPDDIPDDVILQELSAMDFYSPNVEWEITHMGIESTYSELGFTFHRARMDNWLRERAEAAGAEYRVGTSVTDVKTDLSGEPSHEIRLANGETVRATYAVLADGPQRQVTNKVLNKYVKREGTDLLATPEANHIAYQEYRRFPEELFEPDRLKFWWGMIPGETAYPWVFPNDNRVARVGLTMPIGLDLETVDRSTYRLLREDDAVIPRGEEYIERLLDTVYEGYTSDDFPVVEGRGKDDGTETYPISSTRPIDSPTDANIAIVGGAMGTTSAFHEGGYHVAVRTGRIAGKLAANGSLDRYNDAWKGAIGDEIRRNVAFADLVSGFGPDDWDEAFRVLQQVALRKSTGGWVQFNPTAGLPGLLVLAKYKYALLSNRDGRYVQLSESEYDV